MFKIGDSVKIKHHPSNVVGTVKRVRKSGKLLVEFWDTNLIPPQMSYHVDQLGKLSDPPSCSHKWKLEKRFLFDVLECSTCGKTKNLDVMKGIQ